jgi:hypothetical protein
MTPRQSESGRPVTRTAPASKDLVTLRAIVAAAQARRPWPGQRANRRDRPAVRTPSGLALTAAGLMCTLAVHIQSRAVNVRTGGIIVMALGLAWLWIPVRHKRARLRRQFDRAIAYLAWDPGRGGTVRCSLAELLEPEAARTARETDRAAD